ncbi:hypothetical protein [Ramlibacter sp. AN1133]|uniref:hypothetical protein n=1 Tax=Ramlibacter sp. AN1133 TaxID=3133429 RepID=UPI0030BB3CA2
MTELEGLTFATATGFSPGPVREMLKAGGGRYQDICGPDIGSIMASLGWSFLTTPLCVTALDEHGHAVAAGWAAPSSHGEAGGINLSYAAAPQAEGRGLALLTTSLAIVEISRRLEIPEPARVHAQYRVENARSAALAARLGLSADPGLTVDCELPGERMLGSDKPGAWIPDLNAPTRQQRIVGSSGSWPEVLERARNRVGELEASWVDFAAGRHVARARERV